MIKNLTHFQTLVLSCAVVLLPAVVWADVNGTPTLAPNTTLNLDTGATGAAGDITWTGTAINVQPGATMVTVPCPTSCSTFYDLITQQLLTTTIPVLPTVQTVAVPAPSQGVLVGVKTRGGNYAKLLVTGGTPGGSITTKFLTYGATGGGGGTGGNGPSITTVQNNYGLIAPGLPNYGIAPSTLFFITGSALSNTTTDLLSSASPGLQTTVNGVSVSVTSGGTTLQCPLYYLSPTQIDAILPGTTPLGNATITVTNNGNTSASFQIVVVQSAFGILSYNGSLGAAYDANNQLITSNNAANPNQTIVLWGSGVGYDPKDDDKLYPQAQDNLTNIPMQAYVGGVAATIVYRGRSQFPGVDQVVITIPASAPTGCYVSLAIVSGNIVSNSVTIPIAASGRTCSDEGSSLPPDVLQTLSGKTTIRTGFLAVTKTTIITGGSTTTNDGVFGSFQSVSGISSSAAANQVSTGSCVVFNSLATLAGSTSGFGLDAGAQINVTGPGGPLTLSQLSLPGLGAGFYAPPGGNTPAGYIPTNGGAFGFDNGAGGKDVGHFTANLNVPAALTWTNAAQISTVTRAQGVNVTWTGGAPGTYVQITGGSAATINGKTVSVTFICQAPVSAGQFSVPVPVLLALPASANASLSVGDYTNLQTFTAPGIDLGLLTGGALTSKVVGYN